MLRQRLDDGADVADVQAFVQQVLQHLLHGRDGQQLRANVFDQLRCFLGQMIEQLLHFQTAEKLGAMGVNQLIDVRGDDRAAIDNGIALGLRAIAHIGGDPHGRQAEGRVHGGGARQLRAQAFAMPVLTARVDGQELALLHFAVANLHALERDAVRRRTQLQVVANVHNRCQEAHVLREFLADALDAAQQLAVLALVDQRDQAVADLQTQHVDPRHVVPARFRRIDRGNGLQHGLDFGNLALLLEVPAQITQAAAKQDERDMRHARHQAQQADHTGGGHQHHRHGKQLARQLLADVLVGGHAADHDARRGGDHQRGNLRNQAVANGQQRVVGGGVADVHVVLEHAHGQAADDVDQQNGDTRHRIATHELAGTVHGAEEFGFLGDGRAALAGFVFADQAGVQVGVDGHLLARHRIEREARADLGDPARTLADHHEVDDHQDDEQHDADGVVAAHREVAEGFDDLASGVRAGVAFHQHHARGGDVQRLLHQRGDQQNAGERREIQWPQRVHADQQHDDRQRDVEGEQQVQDERRQRQHHHRQDQDDQHRAGGGAVVALAQEAGDSEQCGVHLRVRAAGGFSMNAILPGETPNRRREKAAQKAAFL